MSITRRTKRPGHATRAVDLSELKEALAEGKIHTAIGTVTDEGVDNYFSIEDGDLIVELELHPGGEQVSARMGVGGGGSGQGIWFIPPPGTEVAVLVPDGDLECGPIIVGIMSSGGLPDGVAPGVTVVANSSKVLIHDGSGGTDQLVTKTAYEAHVHPTGVGPSGPADNASVPASYTQILEAK